MGEKLDVQRRQHRERGQPANRQRLGLLEKHRDYVARARDYHGKQDRIKSLKRKAAERNTDEFYFGMIKGQTNKGVHITSRGAQELPNDVAKLLKTQDVKYIRTQRTSEERKIKKLREQIASQAEKPLEQPSLEDKFDEPIAGPSKPKRIVFTDSLNTPLGRSKGKSRAVEDDASASRSQHLATLQAELDARVTRNDALSRAEREVELQRLLMAKGSAKGIVKRKRGEDEPEQESDDDAELAGPKKARLAALPKPEVGVKTGARVWKWKAQRQR